MMDKRVAKKTAEKYYNGQLSLLKESVDLLLLCSDCIHGQSVDASNH